MFKVITLLGMLVAGVLCATQALAVATLSLRVETPKTPVNINKFNIGFVALDLDNDPVTVTCFKKGPSDNSFSQLGNIQNLSSGGDSGFCQVDESVINKEGTYQFYLTAQSNGEFVQSTTMSVNYQTASPANPGHYSKEYLPACQYKITFKTGDDGITSRVEVYRSDSNNFTAEGGTRVGTIYIGPDESGSYIDTVPDCGKKYYYVIRAFDGAGNGSGVIGDSETKVTIVTTQGETTVTGSGANREGLTSEQGAIPVSGAQVGEGEILGESAESTEEGEVLSSEEDVTEGMEKMTLGKIVKSGLPWMVFTSAVILGSGYYFYRRNQK